MAKKKNIKLKVKQIKSAIGYNSRQRRTLEALGITKMNQEVIHNDTPQIRGMVNSINHLVAVEEVTE